MSIYQYIKDPKRQTAYTLEYIIISLLFFLPLLFTFILLL